jgi:hypothetical protein
MKSNLGKRWHGVVGFESLETRRLFALNMFGAETTVPSKGSDSFTDSQSAVAANGAYIIARVDRLADGNDFTMKVSASRYSANGKLLGTLVLDSFPQAKNIASSEVSVSMDADGDAVVAYSQDFESAVVPSFQFSGFIKLVRVSRAGVATQPVLIADGRVGEASVSMDSSGGYYVGWLKHWIDSDPVESVQTRAFSADGSPRGPRIVAASDTGTFNGSFSGLQNLGLQIGSTPDGAEAVFETAQLGTNDHYGELGRVTAKKTLGSSEFGQISFPAQHPALAVEADGSFFVGFAGPGQVSGDVFALVQRFDADDNEGQPITLTGAKNSDNVDIPSLSATPGGGFIAFYSQSLKQNVLGRVQTVYGREYAADGTPIDPAPVTLQQRPDRSGIVAGFSSGTDANGQTLFSYETNDAGSSSGHYIRLTTNIAAIDKSVLYLFGTSSADSLSIKSKGTQIVARRDKTAMQFPAKSVLATVVSGFGGNDTIANLTTVPSTLRGGAGNDTLIGTSGLDSLDGGAGDDQITLA